MKRSSRRRGKVEEGVRGAGAEAGAAGAAGAAETLTGAGGAEAEAGGGEILNTNMNTVYCQR